MSSEAFGGNPNFLTKMELSAQASYTQGCMSVFDNAEDAASLCAALSWPGIRPLMELHFNEAVDAAGGLVLQALGFAHTEIVHARFRSKKTKAFKAISLSEQGLSWVKLLQENHDYEKWFIALDAGISSYVCRDLGAGIALGKDFLHSAIKHDEVEVLRRVIAPDDLRLQFPNLDTERRKDSDGGLRLEENGYMRSPDRPSPQVFFANFGLYGMRWSETARDTAFDLIENFRCIGYEVRRGFRGDL